MRPLALLPLLAVAACEPPGPFTTVTYNAGLAVGFVPASEARAPLTAEAIGGLEADAVCLQEVWQPEHVSLFDEAAAAGFPERYFPAAQPERLDTPACAEGDLDGLLECIDTSCSDACDDELIECVFASCALDFVFLDKPCMSCVQAEVGSSVDAVEEACTTGDTRYAYEGSFGTGVLARDPILSTEEHVFASTTNRRSALHAVLDAPGGEVDFYCTHLTAVFDVIPYPKEEGSWEEEQAVQIGELSDWIDSTATADRVILAGDFNTGPDVGDSLAEIEDSWDLLAAMGMDEPYIASQGDCTYCPGNPLNLGDEQDPGKVIDHVFLRGFGAASSVERILTDELEVQRCEAPFTAAYSDHYGVKVTADAGD